MRKQHTDTPATAAHSRRAGRGGSGARTGLAAARAPKDGAADQSAGRSPLPDSLGGWPETGCPSGDAQRASAPTPTAPDPTPATEGTHAGECVYGTRARCLLCGHIEPRPRVHDRTSESDVDQILHTHPGVLRGGARPGIATRTPGIQDVSGWGVRGNPWG